MSTLAFDSRSGARMLRRIEETTWLRFFTWPKKQSATRRGAAASTDGSAGDGQWTTGRVGA